MADTGINANKELAVDFLQLVVAGKIDEAYNKHVELSGKHHNAFFPAGFRALQQAMQEDHVQSPDKHITVVNVIAENDLVAVHSHLVRGADHMAVVHLFRCRNNKIVELWDCGQVLPPDSPNIDGAF